MRSSSAVSVRMLCRRSARVVRFVLMISPKFVSVAAPCGPRSRVGAQTGAEPDNFSRRIFWRHRLPNSDTTQKLPRHECRLVGPIRPESRNKSTLGLNKVGRHPLLDLDRALNPLTDD